MTRARDLADSADKDITGTLTVDGISSSGDITLADNAKAIFGAGSDLQIYHNGTKSIVSDVGTGVLRLAGTDFDIMNSAQTKRYMLATDGGAATLYYDNAAKIATTAAGVDITAGDNAITTKITNTTGANYLQITNGTANGYFGVTGANTVSMLSIGTHPLTFGTDGGTERLRIDSSGNAFMKTANSYIAGTTSLGFYGDAASSNGMFINSSGSVGIGTSSPTSNRQLTLYGNDAGLQITGSAAGSNAYLTSTPGSSANFYFGTTSAKPIIFVTNGENAERMRIDSSGNLLVGTTTNIGGARFSVEHPTDCIGLSLGPSATGNRFLLYFRYNGTTVGSVTSSGSSTAYNTTSDYRLKTDVTYNWDATSRLKQLKPARFAWIADGDDAVPVDGFLAHEVQDIVPEAIVGEKDAMRDEEYTVSAATGDIYTPAVEATYDDDGVELTAAVDEVIHSADVERPEELAEGQQWRETTAAVMGTRSVPDWQGIDQSKLVPLLVKTIQELEARITALEAN